MPPIDIFELKKHENEITRKFINNLEENEHTVALKKVGFHAGYSVGVGFENILMKKFELPLVKWFLYLPDPMFTAFNRLVYDTSTSLPLIYPFP